MAKFREFLVDVFMRWDPIMSGVLASIIIAAASYLYEIRNGKGALPWYFYVVLSFGFIFYACFQAWRDKDRDLQEVYQQLDNRAYRREQQEKLPNFIEEGKQIQELYGTPGPTFVTEVAAWTYKVYTYLQENLGRAYVTQ